MTPIILAEGLHKHYGDIRALDGVDLVAEPGRVTALLGPNGAGKTTFVRMVATLAKPTSGRLRVAGIDTAADPAAVRRVIGLAGQHATTEPAMTGRENLEMVGRLFGLDRPAAASAAAAVLERLDLGDAADRLVRDYSGGMRRRLDLGASLVGRPRLLLLDEPTTGLDPRSRLALWDDIRALVADGTDVLLTTQYLEEADQLARDVVIVDHGRVIAAGTPDELKRRTGADVLDVRPRHREDLEAVADALAAVAGVPPDLDRGTQRVSVRLAAGADHLARAVHLLRTQDVVVDDIGVRRPTLDEAFLALTRHPGAENDSDPDRSRTAA